jgi:hypothetical protein
VLEGYVPSYDATCIARLRAQGAIVVGKTNMDEFGMGSTTETSGYHVTRNPCDLSRSPGEPTLRSSSTGTGILRLWVFGRGVLGGVGGRGGLRASHGGFGLGHRR